MKIMVLKNLILISFVFCFIRCDMFYTNDKRLVGDILLINPHNQDVHGYRMVIFKDNINSNVLEEDIVKVCGNDSLLLVKSKNSNADYMYYKINHFQGKQIIKTVNLSLKDYTLIKESIKMKYSFNDE
jgi:hypothetical protein